MEIIQYEAFALKSGSRLSKDPGLMYVFSVTGGQMHTAYSKYVPNLMTNIQQLLRNLTAVSDSNYITKMYAQKERVQTICSSRNNSFIFCGSLECVCLSVHSIYLVCECSLDISTPNSVLISKVLPWHIWMKARKQLRLYGMTTGVMTIWMPMTTKGAAIYYLHAYLF